MHPTPCSSKLSRISSDFAEAGKFRRVKGQHTANGQHYAYALLSISPRYALYTLFRAAY